MSNTFVACVMVVAVVIIGANCRQVPERAASGRDTTMVTSNRMSSDTGQLAALIDSLARIPGSFTSWDAGRWEFTGSSGVLSSFDQFSDRAVIALVDCLDRSQPSQATARGRTVPHGVMCYWALRRLAYVENEGDPESRDTWPGQLEPTASAQQLAAAKEAWLRAVRDHRYHLT
jgi:hypothetical protein